MVNIFSSPPFYTNHVKLPNANGPIPLEIQQNPKFWPYLKDALGAINGSHTNFAAPASLHDISKGFISQSCLLSCLFSLQFFYVLTGWEGSATDAQLWNDAINDDLVVPEGKYYLSDAGFGACDQLLLPYQGVHYHLAEWGHANVQYVTFLLLNINLIFSIYSFANKEELFNLHHASARNVIEHIFGVLKHRF